MTAGHEADIATYLTADGQVFLAPQYQVAFDPELKEGGSCPDFVALDFRAREILIVEVTTATDWRRTLLENVRQRQTRWYSPVRRRMQELGILDNSWKGIRFLGFVREENLEKVRAAFASEHDVTFYAIEKATFLWQYWDQRLKDGLPR